MSLVSSSSPPQSGQSVRFEKSAITFVLSSLLGAILIFLVQPMFAKMATPLLGGSPSVWNVSLVCFQAALLAGYTYAHVLSRLTSLKRQLAIHGVVLLLGFICLPLSITDALGPPDAEQPALWLIGVFALSVALPFIAVSATAPLIQNWYAYSERDDANDPYHLYSASNIGSLVGLAAYPLFLEPFTKVATQSQVWMLLYGVLAVLLLSSGFIVARKQNIQIGASVKPISQKAPLSWTERAKWLGFAFIPSSLLVGTTTHITTDIAAAPFLWVPPLALYILSFVFVFSKKPILSLNQTLRIMPIAVALLAIVLPRQMNLGTIAEISSTLLALFMIAMACHGLLAQRRPDVSRLTEFYLIMSLGGVLGGAFNALLAPVLFSSTFEYPLMLTLALLVIPTTQPNLNRYGRYALIALTGCIVFASFVRIQGENYLHDIGLLSVLIPAGIMIAYRSRPIIVAAAFLASWSSATILDELTTATSERGFFGIVKVIDLNGMRMMLHGNTLHGAQYLDQEQELDPLTYYAPQTPIGQTFNDYPDATNIGVVGLGVGSMACYAKAQQNWTFFEIDPIVIDLARDPTQFTFVSKCAPDARMVLGDARIQLQNEPDGQFEILVLDAFSSNAIPIHLVTLEALQLYLDKLSDDGVFVAHISNRNVALERIFARLASQTQSHILYQIYSPDHVEPGKRFAKLSTKAVMIAKNKAALDAALSSGKWETITADQRRPWTDDYSNMIGAMLEKK